jgi:DnaJ-class molecular chaperone
MGVVLLMLVGVIAVFMGLVSGNLYQAVGGAVLIVLGMVVAANQSKAGSTSSYGGGLKKCGRCGGKGVTSRYGSYGDCPACNGTGYA